MYRQVDNVLTHYIRGKFAVMSFRNFPKNIFFYPQLEGQSQINFQLFHQTNIKTRMEDKNKIFSELLERVGNDGKYQQRISVIIYTISMLAASSFFINPYLFYQQPYLCNGVQSIHCTQHVCTLPLAQRQQYLAHPMISSLGNNNPTYFCNGISTVLFMEEGILLGTFLGVIFAVLFSDIVGRRKTILMSLGIPIIGILLTVFVQLPLIRFIGLVLWGSGSQVTFGIGITILLDSTDYRTSGMIFTIFAACVAIGGLVNVLLFFILKNWILVLLFYYALVYAITFLTFFFFVESPPIEIISHNSDPQQSYKAFMRIARVNGKQNHGISFEQIQRVHQEYHQNLVEKGHTQSFTCIDLCRYASLRWDFIIMSVSFSIQTLMEYGPVLLEQSLLPDIFISGTVNGVTLLAALPFLNYTNTKVSRRRGNMFFCFMIGIFMLAQFLFNPSGCTSCLNGGKYVLMLILFSMSRFFANLFGAFFFVIMNQSFPQQIRAPAINSISAISRLANLLIPYIPKLFAKLSLSVNLFFSVLALVGTVACFLMRQTLGLPPQELIEELKLEQGGKEQKLDQK